MNCAGGIMVYEDIQQVCLAEIHFKQLTFLVLDFGLHIVNCVTTLHFERYCLPCQCFYKDLQQAQAGQVSDNKRKLRSGKGWYTGAAKFEYAARLHSRGIFQALAK